MPKSPPPISINCSPKRKPISTLKLEDTSSSETVFLTKQESKELTMAETGEQNKNCTETRDWNPLENSLQNSLLLNFNGWRIDFIYLTETLIPLKIQIRREAEIAGKLSVWRYFFGSLIFGKLTERERQRGIIRFIVRCNDCPRNDILISWTSNYQSHVDTSTVEWGSVINLYFLRMEFFNFRCLLTSLYYF